MEIRQRLEINTDEGHFGLRRLACLPGAYYPRAITQPAARELHAACNTFSLERRREHLHYMLGDFRLTITPV